MFHIYHDKLPGDLSVRDALQLMRLADRFQAPACLAGCSQHLQQQQPGDLDWEDVAAFYSIEPSLREGAMAEAAPAFVAKLKGAFLAFEDAWRDDDLRRQFLGLQLVVVEALAALDELQVVSENTVATALAAWIAHDKEARLPAAKQLLGHLRLQHLTQSFVGDVLLELVGLGGEVTTRQLAAALQYCTASALVRSDIKLQQRMKPPRAQPASQKLQFEWRPRLQDLVQLVQQRMEGGEKATMSSPVQRWNGYQLQLVASASSSKAGTPHLYVYAQVTADPSSVSGPGLLKSGSVTGTVMLPDLLPPRRNHFTLDLYRVGADTGTLAVCRQIKLGEKAVTDAATLLAALTSSSAYVEKVATPAPASRVAELQEVPFQCTIASCD